MTGPFAIIEYRCFHARNDHYHGQQPDKRTETDTRREITAAVTKALQVHPDMVTILIHEPERENIGKSGHLMSDSQTK